MNESVQYNWTSENGEPEALGGMRASKSNAWKLTPVGSPMREITYKDLFPPTVACHSLR